MYLPRIGLFFLATLIATSQQTPDPDLRLSSENAPPGATLQLKLFLATPRPILNANLTISLDPAFFGDIQSVAVFSAAGDAAGQATVQGRTATLEFSSVSGGIGRLSALPVAVVNVPLLPTLRPGASVTVAASASSPWKDAQGVDFTPRFQPAPITVSGTLSLRPPTPLADLFPKDSVLTLEGTGFTPATAAEIDGAAIAETAYVSPERIRIKLSGPTTLSGKRIRLRNPNGDTVQHYAAQPAIVSAASLPPGFFPLPPLQVATDWTTPALPAGILIQNPHPQPVEITIKGLDLRRNVTGRATRQLQSGQSLLLDNPAIIAGGFTNLITAPVPIRVSSLQSSAGKGLVLQAGAPILPFSAGLNTSASQLEWVWQPGEPAPAAKQLYVCSATEELNFSVQAATASGGPWLSAPATGRSIFNVRSCLQVPTDSRTVEIRVNPAGLPPGTYTGTLTLIPEGDRVVPTIVNVQLIVSEKPYISASLPRAHFNFELGKSQPPPQTLEITSNGSPAEFTAQSSFENAPPWLTLSPTKGVTPASLTLTFDPAGLGAGNYSGAILVRGPANTLTIPVSAGVYGPPTPRPVELNPSPNPA